jgi:NADH-quinone oxidoreductase subunit E
MYKRRPVGDYHVGVCTNTLCAVMGGDAIFERLKDHLEIGNDETTPSEEGRRSVTLEHVECNAACDFAPVVMVNWEFMDNQTPQSATELVDDLRAGNEVVSTRGPRICTWREAERVLAGFPDGLADEGPAAGPPSLLGLQIARENGWQAPRSDRDEVTSGEGREATDESGLGAQTSMGRASAEGDVEESGAETVGEDAGGEQNPKGGS